MKHFRMLARVIFESSYQHDGLEWRVAWRDAITLRNRICYSWVGDAGSLVFISGVLAPVLPMCASCNETALLRDESS